MSYEFRRYPRTIQEAFPHIDHTQYRKARCTPYVLRLLGNPIISSIVAIMVLVTYAILRWCT